MRIFSSWIPFALFLIIRISVVISYNKDINGHLKRAADANTAPIALKELDIAIANMEARGYTEGYTSIVYQTPDEDVGFWYENTVAARDSIARLGPDSDQLTVSNELMKLRETLLDHGKTGELVTEPSGIPFYPHNKLHALTGWSTLILGLWFSGIFAKVRKWI